MALGSLRRLVLRAAVTGGQAAEVLSYPYSHRASGGATAAAVREGCDALRGALPSSGGLASTAAVRRFASSASADVQGISRDMVDRVAPTPDATQEEKKQDDGVMGETDGGDQAPPGSVPQYLSTEMSTKLTEESINMYYEMLSTHEGFPKGLAEEFSMSGTQFVMYRSCTHQLFNSIEASFSVLKRSDMAQAEGKVVTTVADRQAHFLLQGPRGSGKSIALASAVEFSRLCGAVVLYVPSCLSLVDGGMYHKSESGDGWDTPDQAREILNNLVSSHGHRLAKAQAVGMDGTMLEVAEQGLSRGGNSMDALLAVIEGLKRTKAFPVVFALDDYNVLYSHTAYYEAVTFKKRRMIMPDELRLANALRVLEKEPLANGICIAAPTYSSSISPKLKIPYQQGSLFQVPPLDDVEMDRMAEFYTDYEVLAQRPDSTTITRMSAMTCGDGGEFRKYVGLTA